MASLLPLLHDLLPMLIPSEVHVARGSELVPVRERAERPRWYKEDGRTVTDKERHGPADSSSGSDHRTGEPGEPGEQDEAEVPIQLLDREGYHVTATPISGAEMKASDDLSVVADHAPVRSALDDGPRVFRKDVMVGVTDKMCVSDALVHATSGQGVLLISPSIDAVKALRADLKGEQPTPEEERPRRIELGPGDFAFIPAWTEHQAVNERGDEDVIWVVTRLGSGECAQVDLDGWGGERLDK